VHAESENPTKYEMSGDINEINMITMINQDIKKRNI